MTETKRLHSKMDEFINSSLNTSAALHPRLVAWFRLLLYARHFWVCGPTYHLLTTCLFNNIPAFDA
jgi:hypothetical protein